MLKHRSLSATAMTLFVLLVAGMAHADVAGSWKLTVGHADPCTLTLSADKTAAGCEGVDKWKTTARGIELLHANGDVYGTLDAKGEGYEGRTYGITQNKLHLSH